jgi:hypothetical protein
MRALFEQHCRAAGRRQVRVEWSVKIGPSFCDDERWIWSGPPTPRAIQSLNEVLGKVSFPPVKFSEGRARWRALLERGSQRLLLACGRRRRGGAEELKVYLALKSHQVHGLLASFLPDLARTPLPGRPALTFGYSLDGQTAPRPRAYLFFSRSDLDQAAVQRFLARWVNRSLLEMARLHPTVAIGLKPGATDMFCLGFRPYGQKDPPLSPFASPVIVPVLSAARRFAPIARAIDRLTWVALPVDTAGWPLPAIPEEMNLYLDLGSAPVGQGRTSRKEMSQSRKYAGGASRNVTRQARSPSRQAPPR